MLDFCINQTGIVQSSIDPDKVISCIHYRSPRAFSNQERMERLWTGNELNDIAIYHIS